MARQKPDRSGPLTPEQARTGYRALRTSILGGLASAWGVFAVIAATRPGVLTCRKCRRQTGLTVGTVMESSHTPLSTWFWAAYLVTSQTPGMSAVQFQRQLGLSRYETAFQILHKLRAGMVRPDQDRIGARPKEHVEVDEVWIGGRTRDEGRGVHHKTLVAAALLAPPAALYRMHLDLAALSGIDWYANGSAVLKSFNDTGYLS